MNVLDGEDMGKTVSAVMLAYTRKRIFFVMPPKTIYSTKFSLIYSDNYDYEC